MASDDGEDTVGSDDDGVFNEDFEALKRACLLTGTDPNTSDFHKQYPSAVLAPAAKAATVDTHPDEEADDDFELVRNIQKRFAIVTDVREPLTLDPVCSILPRAAGKEEDFEDDFETLRAIQRRFASYSKDGIKDSTENVLHHGGVTNLALEADTSKNLFLESSNAEKDPSYVGKINNTPNSESSNKLENGAGPSELRQDLSSADALGLPIKSSLFPKAAEAFVEAIKNNRSCQKLIRSKLRHIESRIEELKTLKERVKILRDFQISCRRRTGRALSLKKDARIQLISASKISHSSKLNEKKPSPMQYGPAENPQVAKFREAVEKSPTLMGQAKWSKEENEKLANGLKQQFQEALLQRSLDLLSDGDGLDESSGNFDGIVASISDVDISPEKMRLFLPKVNWDYLASLYIPARSGAECQARWLNCEDPLINQNPWTSMEDKILLHVVQQKGLSNWIDIAKSVGTNRTPFQCLSRYQRSLNASIIKREWTEEEDDQLRAAVEAFGESNWQIVASAMEGRTGTQCSNRWMKTLHPARQRVGRWTADEDKCLKVAVMLFGPKNWKKIAEFVPGRTQVQCRERWVNSLDPSLNLDTWTEEEDSKLKEAIEHHGYCWSKVAACIPPRTDSQCRRRWKVLLPHQVPLLRAARVMQKAALISNFVDRESERPALRPDDFVPPREISCLSESEHVSLSGKRNQGFRHRREDALANPCSGDLSNEVPRLANGTEEETLSNTLVSKNKRRKRHLKKTKSICSLEENLSPRPDLVESLATKNIEELEISGADKYCPEMDCQDPRTVSRDMLMSKGTGSVLDVTSDERARESPYGRDGGSDRSESNLSSLGDLNSSMIAGGEEVHNLIREEKPATFCIQGSGLRPCNNSCRHGRCEDGGCDGTEPHQSSLTDTALLTTVEEVCEVGRNVGAATWRGEVSELQPIWSECNEPRSENPGISISHCAVSGNRDDIITEKQIHATKSTSKMHKSADEAAHQLSSSSTLKMYSRTCAGGSRTLKRSRNRGGSLSEDAVDDDMTLASFCSKLKTRKVKFTKQLG